MCESFAVKGMCLRGEFVCQERHVLAHVRFELDEVFVEEMSKSKNGKMDILAHLLFISEDKKQQQRVGDSVCTKAR